MARTVAEVLSEPVIPFAIRWQSRVYSLLGLAALLIVVVMFATTVGSVHIPLTTTFQVLVSQLPFVHITPSFSEISGMPVSLEILKTIIIDIRLPRVLLAGLVGDALAVVYSLARVGKTLPATTLILAGVALSALLSSATSYLMTISGKELHGIVFWLLGGLYLTKWSEVWTVLPCVLAGLVVIWIHARPLNVMQLDEDQAQQLGINVGRVKVVLLAAATLITSSAICFTRLIGFVGILIPPAVRLVWGPAR